jgi:hypothetical protein
MVVISVVVISMVMVGVVVIVISVVVIVVFGRVIVVRIVRIMAVLVIGMVVGSARCIAGHDGGIFGSGRVAGLLVRRRVGSGVIVIFAARFVGVAVLVGGSFPIHGLPNLEHSLGPVRLFRQFES